MLKEQIWNKRFIMLVLINTVVFLGFNMSTSGFPAYVAIAGSSNISTGLVTALSAVAALLMRPFAGWILDKRNERPFTLLGLFLLSAPLICVFSSNISVILAVRFLQGAGWGITSTSCAKLIANNLPRERLSEGIGYTGVLSSVATAFAPGLAIAIFEENGSGWMFGFISLCSIIAVFILLPLRQKNETEMKRVTMERDKCVIARKAVVPAIFIMVITMTYAPMVTFITPYSKEIGIPGTKSFFLAYAFSTIFARPLTGMYVDRRNTKLPTIVALATAMLASIFLAKCNSVTGFIVSGALAGLSTGAGMNALQTSAIKKSADSMRGVAIATFLFGFDLGMAMGSFAAGILLNTMGFPKMFVVMSFPTIIALGGIVISILIKYRAKG